MDCDYCGPARPATFEVTAEDRPAIGNTRYVCAQHLTAAEGHIAQIGTPTTRGIPAAAKPAVESPRSVA